MRRRFREQLQEGNLHMRRCRKVIRISNCACAQVSGGRERGRIVNFQ